MLALALSLALSGPPAARALPPAFEELGLSIDGERLRYDWTELGAGRLRSRLLTEREAAEVRAFLAGLPPDAAEAALAAPMLEFIGDDPPDGYVWFRRAGSGWTLTPQGKKDLVRILLSRRLGARFGSDPPLEVPPLPRFAGLSAGTPDFDLGAGRETSEPVLAGDSGWDPLGPMPTDRWPGRGYAVPSEGAKAAAPGETWVRLQFDAANFIQRDVRAGYSIVQKHETHTWALDLRHGVDVGIPVELGARLRFHANNAGYLDPFIKGVERLTGGLGNTDTTMNEDRFGDEPLEHTSYRLTQGGRTLFEHDGSSSGWGDLLLTAKTPILDDETTRIAARLAWNIATGREDFTDGHFAGIGLGVEHELASWLALHGDVGLAFPLERRHKTGLQLQPAALSALIGLEAKLFDKTSLVVQVDAQQSPFHRTGIPDLDSHNAGIGIGLNQCVQVGKRTLQFQLYCRENFQLEPFGMHANADPDFNAGLSVTIR